MCVLCTSCSMGITLTNYKRKFRLCSLATNDIMQHFSRTSHLLHRAHVVYQFQLKNLTAWFLPLSPSFQKPRHFQRTNLNPYFPKMLQSKKLRTKISSQTEFTMSQRPAAHNKENEGHCYSTSLPSFGRSNVYHNKNLSGNFLAICSRSSRRRMSSSV